MVSVRPLEDSSCRHAHAASHNTFGNTGTDIFHMCATKQHEAVCLTAQEQKMFLALDGWHTIT